MDFNNWIPGGETSEEGDTVYFAFKMSPHPLFFPKRGIGTKVETRSESGRFLRASEGEHIQSRDQSSLDAGDSVAVGEDKKLMGWIGAAARKREELKLTPSLGGIVNWGGRY